MIESMKKIFALGLAIMALASCNMDFIPSDSMSTSMLKENPSAAIFTTDGIYTLFKDRYEYKGETEDGNYYVRHYFQNTELRGDNVCVSGYSEDPFCFPYTYKDAPTEKNITYFWWMAYKIINAANANIASIVPGASALSDHLLGENYFLRAIAHFHMVTCFAMPYVCGRDNPGVVLRTNLDNSTTVRESVGKVYDQIVLDLIEAKKYLANGEAERLSKDKNYKGYVTLDAATALLARVYLYMEENDKCLAECNELMAHASKTVTESYDFADYPTHTYDHPETIWCIHHDLDDEIAIGNGGASIGSMYLHDEEQGIGWGEHYWSDILIDNFQRYPEDKRFAAYFKMNDVLNDGKVCVSIPFKTKEENDYCASNVIKNLTVNADGSVDFKADGKSYKAVPTIVNTYTEYYVNGIDFVTGKTGANEKTRVFIRPNIGTKGKRASRDYIIYYNTKFNYQNGKAMLHSPVFLRWGEVVLNRAEARAKTNDEQGALDDVNLIRRRAGLTGDAEMTLDNYKERGYDSVLDVVLDERRRELCFEGHRCFDQYRNRRALDRRYAGYQPWEVINYDDKRIAMLISIDEITSSGIPQNER